MFKLYILFGHRKERYDGQHSPEALAIMDEYGFEDNPDYLNDVLKEHIASGEFVSCIIVTTEISMDELLKLLHPENSIKNTGIFEVN